MALRKPVTLDVANQLLKVLNVEGQYDPEQFRQGLEVELEHGTASKWNVTNDDEELTAKIALAHLDENKAYYTALKTIEPWHNKYMKGHTVGV